MKSTSVASKSAFPLTCGIWDGSKPVFFLLDDQVTKPDYLLIQRGVLLCLFIALRLDFEVISRSYACLLLWTVAMLLPVGTLSSSLWHCIPTIYYRRMPGLPFALTLWIGLFLFCFLQLGADIFSTFYFTKLIKHFKVASGQKSCLERSHLSSWWMFCYDSDSINMGSSRHVFLYHNQLHLQLEGVKTKDNKYFVFITNCN